MLVEIMNTECVLDRNIFRHDFDNPSLL